MEICKNGYTDDELNVFIGLGRNAVSTTISKFSLYLFAKDLENRKENIYHTFSNYASIDEYLKAKKTKIGYEIFIKGIVERSIELPFSKVDKIIDFLNFNCSEFSQST